jgi:hypothetical protein
MIPELSNLVFSSSRVLETPQVLLQPVNVVLAVGDVLILHQIAEQRDGRLDPVDDELVEAAAQPHHALDPVAAMHDQLADQAVVIGRDLVALIDAESTRTPSPPGGW